MDSQVIKHLVSDAETGEMQELEIVTDWHGLTVTMPNGDSLIVDLAGGRVTVYHEKSDNETCQNDESMDRLVVIPLAESTSEQA